MLVAVKTLPIFKSEGLYCMLILNSRIDLHLIELEGKIVNPNHLEGLFAENPKTKYK